MKIQLSKKGLWVVLLGISFLKAAVSCGLPILAVYAPHDDLLMAETAFHLLEGNWLGVYTENTLVKGIVHPMFLSAANGLGIPYLTFLTLLNLGACLVFLLALSKLIKNRWILAGAYLALVWNPVFTAVGTYQRVYRCSLTPAQALLLISMFFLLYQNRRGSMRVIGFQAAVCGILLWSLNNCREDGIWVLPFALTVTALLAGSLFWDLKRQNDTVRTAACRLLLFLLPWMIAFGGNLALSGINKSRYGVFLTTELNGGEFPRMIKTIYSVKPEEERALVAVPRSSMDALYDASPTLRDIRPLLEESLDEWERFGRIPGDGEVENGWFFWAVRSAMASGGYYENAAKAQQFCRQVTKELEAAFREGTFMKRKTMPSALMAPWNEEYGRRLPEEIFHILSYVMTFQDARPESAVSEGPAYVTRQFETLTNGLALTGSGEDPSVSGWIVPLEGTLESAFLCDSEGKRLVSLSFTESPDVYAYEKSRGYDCQAAGQARFQAVFDNPRQLLEPVYLHLCHMDGTTSVIPIQGELQFSDGQYEVCIDSFETGNHLEWNRSFSKGKIRLLQEVSRLYGIAGPAASLLSILVYVMVTIRWIFCKRSGKRDLNGSSVLWEQEWLLLSGILGSFFVLVIGVAYTQVSSCDAVNTYYLSGTYALLLAFWVTALSLIPRMFGAFTDR